MEDPKAEDNVGATSASPKKPQKGKEVISLQQEQEARVKRTDGEMKLLRNQREEGTAKKIAELAQSLLAKTTELEVKRRADISLMYEEQLSAFIVL